MVVTTINGGADGSSVVNRNGSVKKTFFNDVPGHKNSFLDKVMVSSNYDEAKEKIKAVNFAQNAIRSTFGSEELRVVMGKTYPEGHNGDEVLGFKTHFRNYHKPAGGSFSSRVVFADGFVE